MKLLVPDEEQLCNECVTDVTIRNEMVWTVTCNGFGKDVVRDVQVYHGHHGSQATELKWM